MPTRLDYQAHGHVPPQTVPMPADVRAAVGRGGWSVVQTGLITTGLALFGVFVLANRLTDSRVMGLYVLKWIPAGPMLVGVIAGSGYLLGAWWHGVGIGARVLAAILLLQVGAYFAAQYAEFQTLNLYHRDTREPVRFGEYFRYTTETWKPQAGDEVDPRDVPTLGRWGYAVRGGEAALFALGGAGAALALVGKPRCRVCRGQLRRRCAGFIPTLDAPRTLDRLKEFSATGNVRAFKATTSAVLKLDTAGANGSSPPRDELPAGETVELIVMSCAVCGFGYLEPAWPGANRNDATGTGPALDRIDLDHRFTTALAPLAKAGT